MSLIKVEIQSKADKAMGKRPFGQFANHIDEHGFVPAVIEHILVIEGDSPQEHAVLLLIDVEGEAGETSPKVVAQISAFGMVKAGKLTFAALESFEAWAKADA